MKEKLLGFVFLISVYSYRSQVVVANFTANPIVICPGQSVQFTDLSTGNPTIWNWTFPGGSPATSTLQNPVVTYNNPGSYNVSLSASNGGLPSVVTTFNYITVNSPPGSPGIISGPLTFCQGKLAMYSVSQLTNAITYSWTVPPTSTLMSGQGTNSITVLIGPGLSTLCVRAGNGCGYGPQSCTVVTGLFSPTITVSPSNGIICSGSSVTLTASGGLTYTWSPPSGLSGTSGSMVVATPTASTVYTVTGTAASGCTNQATANILVLPGPTVAVTPPSSVICTGGSVTLVASGASSYVWSPATGLNTTTGATVVATPSTTTSYTVTGTSTTGCTGRAVAIVSVATAPPGIPGAIVGTPLACAGLTGTYMITPPANASSYSWTVPPGATIVSGQGTNSVMVLFGGSSGSICVSAGNGCGYGASSCLPVFPLAQPVIIVTPPSATLCQGNSTTLIASGASTYSWSPGSGLNNTNTGTVVATPSASIIYTVTGTSTTGCTNTKTVDILVHAIPVVSVTPKNPSICGNGSVTLIASGATSYSWSPATGLNTTTGATVVASPTITTTYTITGSFSTGCSGSAAVTVTVTNLPPGAPGQPIGATVICSGDTASYSVSPVLNASSYSWTVPAGATILSGQGTTIVSVQFGNNPGNICVSAVNACGNGIQACTSVTVNAKPLVAVTPLSATICAGNFVTLTASGASTYSWSPSNSINSTTLATVVAGPLNSITYSVTGTSTNGCSNTASVAITVNQLPVIVISPSTPSMCLNGSATLTASGGATYTWSPAGSLNTTSGPSVIATPSVSTSYTVIGTASTGCQNQAMVTVTVSINPPAAPGAISGPSISCESTAGDYSISLVATALSYSWTVPAGYTLLSGQGGSLVSVMHGTTGGNICVIAINGCGNSTSSCLSVTVSPSPIIAASSSGTGCAGGSVTLSATGATSYSWAPPAGLNSTSGPTVVTTAANNYTVTGTSTAGCSANATLSAIFLSTPLAQNPEGSSNVCSGASFDYTILNEPATTYSWTLSPGLILLSQSNFSVTINATSPGTLCVSGQNTCGTAPPSCKVISLNPAPAITVAASGTINCTVNTVSLTSNFSPTNSSVMWQGPGGASFSTSNFSTGIAGDYTVTVTDNLNSCSSKTTLTVKSHTAPAKFTTTIIAAECAETVNRNNGSILVNLTDLSQKFVVQKGTAISGSTDYNTASFVPPTGLISTTLSNPNEEQPYTVRIIDPSGCYKDTTLILKPVVCDNALFIPQVFTPEGDGKNDLFVITGMPAGTGNSLTVFNRWGNKVFYKADYDNSWDGHANVSGSNTGKKLPTGTYYYVLEFGGGGLSPITGFVVIQY